MLTTVISYTNEIIDIEKVSTTTFINKYET